MREILEEASSAPYDALTTATAPTELQKLASGWAPCRPSPGADDLRGVGDGVHRRRPRRRLRVPAAGGYCADSADAGAADANADDYRRMTMSVTWTTDGRTWPVAETALGNAGNAAGPTITSLDVTPSGAYGPRPS